MNESEEIITSRLFYIPEIGVIEISYIELSSGLLFPYFNSRGNIRKFMLLRSDLKKYLDFK